MKKSTWSLELPGVKVGTWDERKLLSSTKGFGVDVNVGELAAVGVVTLLASAVAKAAKGKKE